MFLVLQHPFADLRSFLSVPSGRLSRPGWPLPNARFDFVRSSGAVWPRRRGGISEWQGEEVYTDSYNAFRFPDHLRKIELGTPTLSAHAERVSRRFNSDGTVARVEIAAQLKFATHGLVPAVTDGMTLLRNFLATSIRVRNGNGAPKSTSLVAAGAPLAAHYLHATTSRTQDAVNPQTWWFKCGVPTLIIDCPESATFMMLPHSNHVLDSAETHATLFHAWLELDKQRVSVWILRRQPEADSKGLRRLRIHLLRFHAERETLRLVLQAAASKQLDITKNTPASESLQQYLNDAVRLLEQSARYGVNQSALFAAVQTAVTTQFEGETATLTQVRRQVAAKVETYLRRSQAPSTVINNIFGDQMNTNIQLGNVTVNGNFNLVTAKHIQNSFNKASGADVEQELKERLKALTVEVTNLVKELPPKQAETVAKDLEVLTNEATSQEPRKAWYELSANGLIDAAKTVAKMAAPVTAAVQAVLALLA